jgi:glycosidase
MRKILKIAEALKPLYGERATEVEDKVENIIKKYEDKIHQTPPYQLSQKDVILITYADTLYAEKQFPIQTLHKFLNDRLDGLINTVHLLPFYPYSSDDGFSVLDYFKVNPDVGRWEDIESFSLQYRLMFDAVVNHISKSSDWFQEYLKGNKAFEDFFIEVDETDPALNQVFRPRALPLVHKYNALNGGMKSVWTTFSEDQIDLNFSNPEVFVLILEVLLFYISKGARLIRLDAVGFLWKKLGTSCIHLPETHRIIQLYRQIIEAVTSDVFFITETNVPHKDNISYFGNGKKEAHMVYNFTLPPLLAFSMITQNIKKLAQWLSCLELPGDHMCYFNFTASHDGVGLQPVSDILTDSEIQIFADQVKKNNGFVSYKNNPDGSRSPYELNCTYLDLVAEPEDTLSIKSKKFILTQAVMLTLPGVPGVYIHSLLGSENDTHAAEETGIYRRINRRRFEIDDLMPRLKNEQTLSGTIFSQYKKILKVRVNEAFFNPFLEFEVHEVNDQVLFIQKTMEKEIFWAIFNFSAEKQQISSQSIAWLDIIENKKILSDWIVVEPYEFLWLKGDIG